MSTPTITANPLLESSALPLFSKIEAAHIAPAVAQRLASARKFIDDQLTGLQSPTWETLYRPLEQIEDDITNTWTPVSHLHGVKNSDELRQAYEDGQQQLTAYYSELGQNKNLYQAYLDLQKSDDFDGFSQAQKQTVLNAIRDFKLSGVGLEGHSAERFKAIRAKLATLTTQFSNNVLDATQGWSKQITDEGQLSGLPEFIVDGAKAAAQQQQQDGFRLTLDLPVYITVMSQSSNRSLREEMYHAFSTRASQFGPCANQWDNTGLIEEILSLRKEMAELLGFENYAQLSIAPKMANTPEQVLTFLQELAQKAKPYAENDLKQLIDFAQETDQLTDLQPWDVAYYSEKLKQQKYNISKEALRPYFPIDKVLSGMFHLVERLYGIQVKEVENSDVWNQEAKYFEISRDGVKIAAFYLDLYARSDKRGGAWMAQCRDKRTFDGVEQLPVAFLVCNFNAPSENTPALLTHDDVTTLFHEFGHGLHHMLTQVDIAAVGGIAGVAWDAVELPSQFMENFCWEPEVLAFISGHYETGEPLPQQMLDNMIAAKNFQSAMQTVRQVEFALFDFRLHVEFGSTAFTGVQELLDDVRKHVAVVIPPAYNQFQNSFSHIFAGGYAAGYYSYKWAEVLSADAYAAFEEEGIFNPQTGERFLKEVLQKGGSDEASNLFKAFRGREPSIDALLRHTGLSA